MLKQIELKSCSLLFDFSMEESLLKRFVKNLLFCKYPQYNTNCNNSVNCGILLNKL
jgi:hypothetical protein